MTFSGSTAIVTGGASGIGLAISERLALDGAKVSVFDLDLEQAERAAQGIRDEGGEAIACEVDVSDRSAGRRGRRADPRRPWSGARPGQRRRARTASTGSSTSAPELWERIIAVNLTGTFHCTQAALPDMLAAKWGRIVNISSSSGQTGAVMMAHYSSSKAGMIGLTKSLALELGPLGITVNTIPPGCHRHADEPPCRRRRAIRGRHVGRRRSPPARAPHRASRRTSRPRARTSCPTRPATSPDRSSASTAAGSPDRLDEESE